MADIDQRPLVSDIPDPETIRVRLAELAREQVLLRSLLRVAKRKQQAQENDRIQKTVKRRRAH